MPVRYFRPSWFVFGEKREIRFENIRPSEVAVAVYSPLVPTSTEQ